jgi:[histone H3]-lysine9 N-trimethyltransferase EHMT
MYTGSGGRLKNQHHVSSDQSLERGNLALERSMNYGVEIRVVRGIILQKSPLIRVYVYDGLYRVVECCRNRGKSGYHVYLFKLLRIKGQEESGTLSIRFAREIKAKLAEQIIPARYICTDISGGIENVPIPLFNDFDKEEYPLEFEYVKSPDFPLPPVRKALKACRCEEDCKTGCECLRRNNNMPAYDSTGILLRGRPILYECGDTCSCPASCPNRVTQRGIKLQLEVFRSKDNIWGVRSLDVIQAGSFICEFSGDMVLREEVDAGPDQDQNRVLIDPLSFFDRWREWGDVSHVFPDSGSTKSPLLQHKPVYLLDVSRRRNVASYMSHSSKPNVFVQFVLHGHDDVKYPRMMIFAMENIPPLRELSLDYGVTVDFGNGGTH